jgi:hypothetical protein
MTETPVSPALIHLLDLMTDPELHISQQLDAARAIIEHEAPSEVFDLTYQFLLGIAEGDDAAEWKLKALALIRKVEAKRVVPGTTQGLDTVAAQALGRRVAKARRRVALFRAGEWPAPEGWDSDVTPVKMSPVTVDGVANRLERARTR